MDSLSASRGGSAPTPPSPASGLLRRFARTAPTAAVLAGLAAAAYFGHTTGWTFIGGKPAPERQTAEAGGVPRPAVRFTTAPAGSRDQLFPGQGARIVYGSANDAEAAGIDITPAWTTGLTEQVAAGGEVMFDPARVARLPARAGGVTRRVLKAAGDPVGAGEVLALIDSAEVGRAKAEFQQALVQSRLRERTRDDLLGAKAATQPAALREGEAAVKEAGVRVLAAGQALANLGLAVEPTEYRGLAPAEAGRRLRLLGVGDAASDLDRAGSSSNLFPVRAPFAGVLLSADVVGGEVVEAGKTLFVVVDPSRVWVTIHLTPDHARRAAAGQRAFFRPDGGSREYPAKVVSVGTAADEATRTVPVRAEAENAAGALRASALGRGRVVFREQPQALVVPHAAVHPFRGGQVVFVRDPAYLEPDGPKEFHVRAVRPGGRDERNAEILAGLSPGEIVATTNSSNLLGELTRATAGR